MVYCCQEPLWLLFLRLCIYIVFSCLRESCIRGNYKLLPMERDLDGVGCFFLLGSRNVYINFPRKTFRLIELLTECFQIYKRRFKDSYFSAGMLSIYELPRVCVCIHRYLWLHLILFKLSKSAARAIFVLCMEKAGARERILRPRFARKTRALGMRGFSHMKGTKYINKI